MAIEEMDAYPGDASDHNCQDGDIRIEYHPNSGHGVEEFRFEEFKQAIPANPPPNDPEPWLPFKTRADFEFAALVQEAKMSKGQINSLIRLFNRCIKNEMDPFTLSSCDEMHKTLKVASERLPKVCSLVVLDALCIQDNRSEE